MSDQSSRPLPLSRRLRDAAQGHPEWRVQDPVSRSYCMSVTRDEAPDPERAAREWLEDHKRRFPESKYARYEVARVQVTTQIDELMLEAAVALERKDVRLLDLEAGHEIGASTSQQMHDALVAARAEIVRREGGSSVLAQIEAVFEVVRGVQA